ncbi:transport-associated ob type 2 [Lucifera butyrica]|uniref:Transport-associated ob type 2 n=1 Tax=Lucifera butyrica TaxID=1351585 RepID=A0A498RII9_9FIRM|nr:sn-glycerol-3-phosphate ABC transporter ATP-binding protein UgpC [Lucifera butyrica]VBB09862.1 transport-associated ob type 2 [Lucifera butyrica]
MAKVFLQGVGKQYGAVQVVKNFNLEINDQEIVVFVGPSGCGKSTTLRMIAGLEEISAGEIYIGDKMVNHLAPKDRNIAMVFQNYALYPHMNVYENMAFSLKLKKVAKTEIDRRVREAAQILQIEQLLDRKPKALSGGQRQRVAMGRAIVREPAVFLMDEPLSNLDAKLRVTMRSEITRLHRRLKTTTIYVTHDQTEAMTMGDRIVVMKDGVIQQVDTPMNLYKKPQNLFVAGFIGNPAMNFITAAVKVESERWYIAGAGFKVEVPGGMVRPLEKYRDKTIIFGIRPEHIHDEVLMLETFPQSLIKAKVEVIELLGAETILHLNLAGKILVGRVPARSSYKIGEQVSLTLDMNHMHVFDPETEQAIYNLAERPL